MTRIGNWRLLAVLIVAAVGLIANLQALNTQAKPFTTDNTQFEISRYIGDSDWVENAPLILSNYFKTVRITHVRNDMAVSDTNNTVRSFGVRDEVVRIFNHAIANYDHFPIDYRNVYVHDRAGRHKALSKSLLKNYVHKLPFGGKVLGVTCAPKIAKDCTLSIYWNPNTQLRSQDVTFVAVRIENNFFALIERNLLNRLTEGAKRA
ncbi:MAG: hypothetical protein RL196_479 [Actinomycetota bacterium]|jgi:hypothetical protein